MKYGLLIPLLLSILLSPVRGLAQSDKPFTIPEVKSWSGAEGSFHYSGLCRLTPEGEEAAEVAVLLRQDLCELLSDTAKAGSTGTISLAIRPTRMPSTFISTTTASRNSTATTGTRPTPPSVSRARPIRG